MTSAPLEVERRGDVIVARTHGDVDLSTAPAVREGCLAAVTNDCIGVVVDLSGSEYLDSAGVRALFVLAERLTAHRQRLAIAVPERSHVRRVLAIVDMEGSASLDETAEAALTRLRAAAHDASAT